MHWLKELLPTESWTTSYVCWSFVKSSAVKSMTLSAPKPLTSSTLSLWHTAVTLAPILLKSWTAAEPMAPVASLTRTS